MLNPGATPIGAVRLTELRTALNGVYEEAARTAPTCTQTSVIGGSAVVRAVAIAELRAAILGLW